MRQISERNLKAHQKNLDNSYRSLLEAYDIAVSSIRILNEKISIYNSVVEDSEDYIHGVVARAEKFYEMNSQKWRDSTEGQMYLNWINFIGSYPGLLDKIPQLNKPDLKNSNGSEALDLPLSPDDLVNKEI
jgi:hypothetical protein